MIAATCLKLNVHPLGANGSYRHSLVALEAQNFVKFFNSIMFMCCVVSIFNDSSWLYNDGNIINIINHDKMVSYLNCSLIVGSLSISRPLEFISWFVLQWCFGWFGPSWFVQPSDMNINLFLPHLSLSLSLSLSQWYCYCVAIVCFALFLPVFATFFPYSNALF